MDADSYVVNVEAAVVRDGEYLLVERAAGEEHAAGLLAFPGGTVERSPDGDAIAATARRELAEEVGVDAGAVEYVHSRTFEAEDGTRCLNVVTLCSHAGGEPRAREPAEVAAVHWLAPAELRADDRAPDYLGADVDRIEAMRGDEVN